MAASTLAVRRIQRTTIAGVAFLALVAAVVSFRHMHELCLRHGEDRFAAVLIPLAVDGLIVVASMSILLANRCGSRGGALAWTLLVVGSLASLGANVAVAEPSVIGRVMAAWPSAALIGSYELLMSQIRWAAGELVHAQEALASATVLQTARMPSPCRVRGGLQIYEPRKYAAGPPSCRAGQRGEAGHTAAGVGDHPSMRRTTPAGAGPTVPAVPDRRQNIGCHRNTAETGRRRQSPVVSPARPHCDSIDSRSGVHHGAFVQQARLAQVGP
ncbi:DUF2637 domain-containing protein [Nonomuraea ceibae]|uniref:DUF2637 domain-containing protein n=1 Tax=Nonomuraea ceibae TaxID=1935170 RepID=UPI001C5E82BF|nr:DUF2637 domain-containing protein [Nonomuraea ceibae]